VAVDDGREQRQRCHDGLAAADVALQQPRHRLGAVQIAHDLGDHALLCAGQRERQRFDEAIPHALRQRQLRHAALRQSQVAPRHDRELDD
jgi:hypothetical protein